MSRLDILQLHHTHMTEPASRQAKMRQLIADTTHDDSGVQPALLFRHQPVHTSHGMRSVTLKSRC